MIRCILSLRPEPVTTETPDQAQAHAKRELTEVAAEMATLPESAKAKLARLADKAVKAYRREFDAEVEKELQKRMEYRFKQFTSEQLADRVAKLDAEREELVVERAALHERTKRLDEWMTKAEFKLVLSCLHPDKPDRTKESLEKAFAIFNRLLGHLEPDRRKLRDDWRAMRDAFKKTPAPSPDAPASEVH